MNKRSKLTLTIFCFLTFSFVSDIQEVPKDYLNIGGKISFDDKGYFLAWSSNPSEGYYKQEYLPKGRTLRDHNDMFFVEAIRGNMNVNQGVNSKISELKKMKKKNPVVNYRVFKKDTEVIIDFVVSDGGELFEWNLYRYLNQESGGDKFLVVYAYSYKDSLYTNDDLKPFFDRIKNTGEELISKLGVLQLPNVNIDEE